MVSLLPFLLGYLKPAISANGLDNSQTSFHPGSSNGQESLTEFLLLSPLSRAYLGVYMCTCVDICTQDPEGDTR